jgi:hypothetical protein
MKSKSLLFVTDRELLKASRAENSAQIKATASTDGPSMTDFVEPPRYTLHDDHIELPPMNIIDTPKEQASSFELEQKWNLALHEAGHCVAALLSGGCTGAGIDKVSGAWRGVVYENCNEGQSRYRIAISGVAAECLGPWPGGLFFDAPDFEHARDELRAKGIPETEILNTIGNDLATMAAEFAERWHKGIRALADALCRQGWCNEDQVRRELGAGQALLTKSAFTTKVKWEDTRVIGSQLVKSGIEQLRAGLSQQLGEHFHNELSRRGLSASETSRLEYLRNRADLQSQKGKQWN